MSGFTVVLSEPSRGRGAERVETPDRVLRLWAMLSEGDAELKISDLPPESVLSLERLLMAAVEELRRSVSPALAEELDRLVPPRRTAPVGLAELRMDYAGVLGWLSGLVISMLAQLEVDRTARRMPAGDARR